MLSAKFIASIFAALVALQSVAASPIVDARDEYPEVIPGEGLPSLESLSVISAQLYEIGLPENM